MKRRRITITAIACLTVFLIIGVPIIINELYKLNCGYITVWNGAELLGYYGTILAAIGGILGVFFTVRYSQKQYREDARQRIMPFIATDFNLDDSCYKLFTEKQRTQNGIIDNNNYKYFIITCDGKKGIQYPLFLSEEKANIIERKGRYDITDKNTGVTISSYSLYVFIPCALKNVGSSAALKTTFGLYKLKNGKYDKEIDDRITSKPLVLDKNEQVNIGLFFDLDDEAVLGTYSLDIMYSDMNYTRYRRSILLVFDRDPKTKVIRYKREDKSTHDIYSTKESK